MKKRGKKPRPARRRTTPTPTERRAALKTALDALAGAGVLYTTPDGRYGLPEWKKTPTQTTP